MRHKIGPVFGFLILISGVIGRAAAAPAPFPINAATSPRPVPMTAPEKKNLEHTLRWWCEVIEAGHLELVPKYQAESYIQHNPNVNTGRVGFLEAFGRDNSPVNPIPAQLEDPPPLAGARGEFVWILWQRQRDRTPTTPLYYQYRFELLRVRDSLVQEHWDADLKLPGSGTVLFGKSTQPLMQFDTGHLSREELAARGTAIEAATQVYFRRQFELVDRLFASDYIEHDPNLPYRPTARERLAGYAPPTELQSDEPAIALVNGEYVLMMWDLRSPDPDDRTRTYPWNYFQLMRIQHGKVVEHWDQDAWRGPK